MDLTHTATIAKRVIVISIVLFVLFIAGYASYQFYKAYKIAHTPPPEEKANYEYGPLSAPDFPQSLAPSDSFTYTLGTTTGKLPEVGNSIRVYFIPKPFATLLAGEKSSNLAAKFEIKNSPQVLTDTKYLYSQDQKTITVEIDSGNFVYHQGNLQDADQKQVDEDDRLIEDFKGFLSSNSLMQEGLSGGRTKIQLLKIDAGGNSTPASSRSEANGAQISIWPADLDKKPIMTPEFNKSLINATFQSSAQRLKNYLEVNYTFWPIDEKSFAVYPLKKPDQAFADLKGGKGVVVIKPTSADVPISSVYLAYFEPAAYTPYLQPVYVFEAPGYAAYVWAIGDQTSPNPSP